MIMFYFIFFVGLSKSVSPRMSGGGTGTPGSVITHSWNRAASLPWPLSFIHGERRSCSAFVSSHHSDYILCSQNENTVRRTEAGLFISMFAKNNNNSLREKGFLQLKIIEEEDQNSVFDNKVDLMLTEQKFRHTTTGGRLQHVLR